MNQHDAATPLFVLYTPHVAHCPLQAPMEYIDKFFPLTAADDEGSCQQQTSASFCPLCNDPTPSWPAGKAYQCRGLYSSMVSYLDDSIGQVRAALQQKGMLNTTLIVLSSDNGGPIGLSESGSSNWPLRGGKYSEFEGTSRDTNPSAFPPLMSGARMVLRRRPKHLSSRLR